MRRHPFGLALLVAGLLALIVGTQGAGAQEPTKTPTAVGSGGAAASVDAYGTQAAIDVLKRGGNAVDAAVAAAGVLGVVEPFSCGIGGGGFMVVRTPSGKVTTLDGRETAPAAMTPTSFYRERRAAGVRPGALQRALRRRARHARHVGARAEEVRHHHARRGAPARPEGRARRLQGRPDLLQPGRRGQDLLRRRPVDGEDLPRRRRHAEGPRHDDHQPRHGQDLRDHRPRGRQARLLPRRRRRGDGRGGRRPADRRRRRPHVAQGLHDRARPQGLQGDRAQAGRLLLPRPGRLRHGPAVQRRQHGRRGAEHPRRLRARRLVEDRGLPPHARGVALRVRRPQRLPGRPGVLRRPARRPDV